MIQLQTCWLTAEWSSVTRGAKGEADGGVSMPGFNRMNSGSLVMKSGLPLAQSGPGTLGFTSGRSYRYDWVSALASRRGVNLMFDVTSPVLWLIWKASVRADTVIGA